MNIEAVVVAIPINPSLLTNKSEPVAELIFNAGVIPKAFETFTERTAEGEVEAIPTLPLVPINIVEVPTAVSVPLKYATCPVVPVKLAPVEQTPLAAVHNLLPFIVVEARSFINAVPETVR